MVPQGTELALALVAMADTLVGEFDTGEFLRRLGARCVELTAVDAVGVMVVDGRGRVTDLAGTSARVEQIVAGERDDGDGPGRDCVRTGCAVEAVDLTSASRWPRVAALARDAGFGSVEAVPMRVRDVTIGAMCLYVRARGAVDADDRMAARALADMAAVGLSNRRRLHDLEELAGQLRRALESRIVVEQAKGVLAERQGQSVDAAFAGMRTFARNRNLRLHDVAAAVVSGGDGDPFAAS